MNIFILYKLTINNSYNEKLLQKLKIDFVIVYNNKNENKFLANTIKLFGLMLLVMTMLEYRTYL